MEKAWQEVESAETPEVKAEKYSDAVDWTMLDKNYDTRTRQTFGTGPVFMPYWWYRADPTISSTTAGGLGGSVRSAPSAQPAANRPPSPCPACPVLMRRLPWSISVTAFSSGVVGNVASFTGAVTKQDQSGASSHLIHFPFERRPWWRWRFFRRLRLCLRLRGLCLRLCRRRTLRSIYG